MKCCRESTRRSVSDWERCGVSGGRRVGTRIKVIQPAAGRVDRVEPNQAGIGAELRRPAAPVADVRAERPKAERFAADEHATPRLSIAVPELNTVPDAARRPHTKPLEIDTQWQIQPDDCVRRTHDHLPEPGVVVAIDHPALG